MSAHVSSSTFQTNAGYAIDFPVAALALGAIALLAGFSAYAIDLRQALLALIGAGFGFALYHGSFSFAGGWRAIVTQGRTASLRAQMVAVGLTSLTTLPLLANGHFLGQPLVGAVGPIGGSLILGSLLFGFGMQLGGGCASGTLYTVGGGSLRMLITLAFFIAGALIGTAHLPWWSQVYNLGVILPAERFGTATVLVVQLLVLGTVFYLARKWELRRNSDIVSIFRPDDVAPPVSPFVRLWRGRWPLVWAAVALALLSVANLLLSGQPWSVTFAFNLWGAKIAALLNLDVSQWEYWRWPMPAQALAGPILAETTSVTNFGLVLGALLAAGLSNSFGAFAKPSLPSVVAAAIGGLVMGYGARLSFGCNIGALFSGIASGSLHGWVWFVFAFAGTIPGTRARRLFGLGD